MVLAVISKTAMLFLILIIGVIARKCRVIDAFGTKMLSSLLVNVTQPMLIIDSFQIAYSGDRVVFGLKVLLASAIIHIIVALLGKILFRFEIIREKRIILEFCLIFGNCAFLGYPVLEAVFSSAVGENPGIFYGAFYTLFFNVFIWTYGVAILSKKNSEKQKTNWRAIFLNIGVIACAIGFAFFLLEFKLPSVVGDAVGMVGDMTFPLSMIIIGSLVATFDFKKLFKQARLYIYTFYKLFALPLLVMAVCSVLPLNSDLELLCVVMASVPAASNCAIFATLYEGDAILAAQCVGLTTLLSMGTIPLNLWIAQAVFGL